MTAQRERSAARVALFFWEGYLSVSPSVVNGLRLLARDGFLVDVVYRTPAGDYPPAPPLPPAVALHECRPISQWIRSRPLLWRAKRWPGLTLLADLLQFAALVLRTTRRIRYRVAIGVDTYGIIAAFLCARRHRIPVIYWSLEILRTADMRTAVERCCKRIERRLTRRAVFTIIQDAERAAVLAAENGMPPDRFLFVPNAPIALPARKPSRYFHHKFGLPDTQRVVLSMGMICDAVLSAELARAAADWPSQYTLVLHEREKRSADEPYLRRILEVGNGRVRLSLDPVPLDELDIVASGGDVGVVLYRSEMGPNRNQMAAASGKLGYFLRAGLPVICPDLPGFREVLDSCRCGVCVRDVAEIGGALDRILAAYPVYRENAFRCFEQRYEFSRFFAPVLAALRSERPSTIGA